MANGNPHTMRSWIGTIVTLLILLFIILFTWRVVYFATLIQSGDLVMEDLSFVQDFSVNQASIGTPIPEGEFDVLSEDDPSLGSPEAKVTIVEFADFGCPFSRKSSFTIRALVQKYGDQVYYQYRDFPIDELHPGAHHAAQATQCADLQGRFWDYHDKLYLNQLDLSDEHLIALAGELNLDTQAFASCLTSGRFEEEVTQDYEDGVEAGVQGTPTFFINGNRISGSVPEDIFDALIQRGLQ